MGIILSRERRAKVIIQVPYFHAHARYLCSVLNFYSYCLSCRWAQIPVLAPPHAPYISHSPPMRHSWCIYATRTRFVWLSLQMALCILPQAHPLRNRACHCMLSNKLWSWCLITHGRTKGTHATWTRFLLSTRNWKHQQYYSQIIWFISSDW